MIVAGQLLTVKEYIPTPRQCNKCWKYGHSIKYCKTDFYTCPICSTKGHQKDDCTQKNLKICTNCQGNQPAFSRSCVQYKKEQLIVKTQFKEGLSYRAAINKLKQTGEISIYNYKKALESNTLLTSTPKAPKLNATNRFSALQMGESQSYGVAKQSNQKSPKRLSKRIRDNSSEEEVSPKLNPKQRPKTKNQDKGNSLQKIIAEVHVGNDVSMDDTIILLKKVIRSLI